MRATIIVRQLEPQKIVRLLDVCSVDEVTVGDAVKRLEKEFTNGYEIDLSQIKHARKAMQQTAHA